MPDEDQPRTPFNEQAALQELERLQRALEESRQRRKHAAAKFDDFVGSFRKSPLDAVDPAPGPAEPPLSTRVVDAPVAALPQRTTGAKSVPVGKILAGSVIVIAAGVVLTRGWRGSPPEPSNPPSTAQTPATGEPYTPTGTGSPAVASAAQQTSADNRSELIAIRDVWVRATVDGARVLERELEAGARVPLRGRSIVIRAGNAGAVRIVIDGQDRGTLGADGVVVTRAYTASSSR